MAKESHELSIDELDALCGAGEDFTLGSMLALESVRLEGTRGGTTTVVSQAPIKPPSVGQASPKLLR